jgi:hypothetical protein
VCHGIDFDNRVGDSAIGCRAVVAYSRNWGYAPSGGLGLVLIIVLILVLLGRI